MAGNVCLCVLFTGMETLLSSLQLCDVAQICDHSQECLAKFGYRPDMKVKNLKNPSRQPQNLLILEF